MSLVSANLRPFIPFDKKAVKRRTPREHATSIPDVPNKWKKFQTAYSGKLPSSIVSIKLSCCYSEESSLTTTASGKRTLCLIVAGSTRVEQHQLSSRITHPNQKRQLVSSRLYTRFKDYVQCIALREDEKLVCASDASGFVQVFDLQRGIQLRKLLGHKGNVLSCVFSCHTFCVTGGEDATLRIWDISDGSCKHVIQDAHKDKITCVASNPSRSSGISFVSGGSDGRVRLWNVSQSEKNSESLKQSTDEVVVNEEGSKVDISGCDTRQDSNYSGFSHKCSATFDHGEAVTGLVFFPSGSLIASSGGADVRIWEATPKGKLVHYIRAHVKTVTCLAVSKDGSYLVTGSIDNTIKFHCCLNGNVLKSISFDDAVTTLHCAKGFFGEEFLCIGFSDGQWMLKQFISSADGQESISTLVQAQEHIRSSFFKRGASVKPSEQDIMVEAPSDIKKFTFFDKLLQSFQHQKALDYAVSQKDGSGLALIDSLIDRNALNIAVRGKTEKTILPIFAFIHREFNGSSQTTPILIEFTHALLNENPWIVSCQNIEIMQSLQRLSSKIDIDLNSHQLFNEILGLVELIQGSSV